MDLEPCAITRGDLARFAISSRIFSHKTVIGGIEALIMNLNANPWISGLKSIGLGVTIVTNLSLNF